MRDAKDPAELAATWIWSADFDNVQYAALDALVQLDCVIPVAELAPFAARYPTLALILASRATADNTPLLLDLLGRAAGYEAYVAVGNLLAGSARPLSRNT